LAKIGTVFITGSYFGLMVKTFITASRSLKKDHSGYDPAMINITVGYLITDDENLKLL